MSSYPLLGTGPSERSAASCPPQHRDCRHAFPLPRSGTGPQTLRPRTDGADPGGYQGRGHISRLAWRLAARKKNHGGVTAAQNRSLAGTVRLPRKRRSNSSKAAQAKILNVTNCFWGIILSNSLKTRFLHKDQLDTFSYAQYSLQIINKAIKIRFPSKQLLLAYFFTFTLKDSILFSIH